MASTPSNVEAGQALVKSVRPRCCGHGSWLQRYMVSWRFDHLGRVPRLTSGRMLASAGPGGVGLSSRFRPFRAGWRRGQSARGAQAPPPRRVATTGPRCTMEEKSRDDTLLTPGEVAARFRVDPKTVTRWANAGKLTAVRTLGGHRRYRRSEVEELLQVSRSEEHTSE